MKKRLLSILAAVILVMAITVPFAVPVMAAAPQLTSIVPDISPLAPPQSYTGVKFYGNNLTATTTIVFQDVNITVSGYSYANLPSYIEATVNVAAGTTHGPKRCYATDTIEGIGPWLYNGFSVAVFQTPPGSNAAGVSLSIQACSDSSGLVPITGTVVNGQNVWYRLTLSVNLSNHFNFYGGQLSVEFPDNLGYHPTAGYGSTTSWAPEIPEVSMGNSFSVVCPTAYVVNSAHLVGGVLLAETDYGPHADNLTQIAGIQEGFSRTEASASVQITLEMNGNLEITKLVDLNGVPATGVDFSFSVTVSGTGGPYNHTFIVDDGVVLSPNPWVLNNLVPGYYNVVETSPAPLWTASGGGLAEVKSGNTTSSTITNDLNPGHLQVTKVVDLNGASGTGISGNFTVTVSGPTYPSGITHNFIVTDGVVLAPNPWTLTNLLSGNYTVIETTPGGNWIASGGGTAEVLPGQTAQSVVTNDWAAPHTTVVSVVASPNTIPVTGGDVTVTVRDSNDGFDNIYNPYFDLTGTPPFSGVPTYIYPTGVETGDGDNIFEPGEIWIFSTTVHVSGDTYFHVVGHGYAGSPTGPDVTGPSEEGNAEVHHLDVPGVSYTGIGILIAGFAAALIFFGWQRRKQVKL
jgi:hypothetical protein